MDGPDYIKFAAALVFVLALMGALGFVMKRVGAGSQLISTGKRRLKIVETLPLDGRRKAVILQRDERQHLVILGPSGETIVETDIETPKE